MSRKAKIFFIILGLLIAGTAVALYTWQTAKAPETNPPGNTNPPPPVTPPPSPTPNPETTTGTLSGSTDPALRITKILIYDSTGKNLVTSLNLDSNRNFSAELAPGTYMIDYQTTSSLYPHEPVEIIINAGQTHQVDFEIEGSL